MKISAALIAWNEERTIDLCLRSLKGFADEVMIADTGSFDGTVDKAQQCLDQLEIPGKIINIKVQGIDQARRRAVDKCTRPWRLIMDSNQVLSEALKKELRQTVKKKRSGMVRSLNLMGDYEHYFTALPFHSAHNMLFHKDQIHWINKLDWPRPVARRMILKNWAVNLSRVRPAWRYWLRGEPFNPKTGREWRTQGNRQRRWFLSHRYNSLLEQVEAEEGKTLDDVKRIAPKWFLGLLQNYAVPLKKGHRRGLPEVLKEEQKNPRYRLIYDEEKIVGRWPQL